MGAFISFAACKSDVARVDVEGVHQVLFPL